MIQNCSARMPENFRTFQFWTLLNRLKSEWYRIVAENSRTSSFEPYWTLPFVQDSNQPPSLSSPSCTRAHKLVTDHRPAVSVVPQVPDASSTQYLVPRCCCCCCVLTCSAAGSYRNSCYEGPHLHAGIWIIHTVFIQYSVCSWDGHR